MPPILGGPLCQCVVWSLLARRVLFVFLVSLVSSLLGCLVAVLCAGLPFSHAWNSGDLTSAQPGPKHDLG